MAGARNGPKAIIGGHLTPYSRIRTYTCSDALALSRGTLVSLIDPMTITMANLFTGAATAGTGFAGVVIRDKEANDGATQVAVLLEGVMDARASGAINAQDAVYCAGNDEVRVLTTAQISAALTVNTLNSHMLGIAEETAADGEVIMVRFNK